MVVWCRGGSRYVEGRWGFPYLRKCLGFLVSKFLGCWFLGFLVSWFQSFLVCWCVGFWSLGFKVSCRIGFNFLGFIVSWFQSFLVSWPQGLNISRSLILYYQISISCFLEDIDSISKILKNSLDGHS